MAKEGGTKAGKPLAPNTIRLARAPLSGALKLGVSLGRTYPVWTFLLGSGLRIGELVSLRWPDVDVRGRRVRVVEFVSTLGYDLLPSRARAATPPAHRPRPGHLSGY